MGTLARGSTRGTRFIDTAGHVPLCIFAALFVRFPHFCGSTSVSCLQHVVGKVEPFTPRKGVTIVAAFHREDGAYFAWSDDGVAALSHSRCCDTSNRCKGKAERRQKAGYQ